MGRLRGTSLWNCRSCNWCNVLYVKRCANCSTARHAKPSNVTVILTKPAIEYGADTTRDSKLKDLNYQEESDYVWTEEES